MGDLANMCRAGELDAYVREYLETPAEQEQAAELFEMAQQALRLLNIAGEYIKQYHV